MLLGTRGYGRASDYKKYKLSSPPNKVEAWLENELNDGKPKGA